MAVIPIRAYAQHLATMGPRLEAALREVVRDHATQSLAIAQTLTPRGPKSTGKLNRSMRMTMDNTTLTGTIGATVFSEAPHARAHELGSGLRALAGPKRKYVILPRRKQALYWKGIAGGRPVAKVMHPGVPAKRFFGKTATRIAPPFTRAVATVVTRQMGGGHLP